MAERPAVQRPTVVWFRRDLRLADHRALAHAGAEGPVVAVFVVDPALDTVGRIRRAGLSAAVRSLATSIKEHGGDLVIRRGDPASVLPAVCDEANAAHVLVTGESSPYGRRRDDKVAAALRASGGELVDVDTPYVVAPGTILKNDGVPYSVFTPYYRRWCEHVETVDQASGEVADEISWVAIPSDADLPSGEGITELTGHDVSESGAWERWADFRAGRPGLDSYDTDRDVPGVDGTSKMSTYLKLGVVHPRQLMAELDPSRAGHVALCRELAFRDFYADVVHHRPHSVWRNLNERFDHIRLDRDADARERFTRWCGGTTGFPIVDAGMRQLAATGWMHNRVRMIVASFLVKDLHLPWQWGARHFMGLLADGDVSSNSQGWQWAAGSGTDAAPYFRVFNPTTQAERWDPDGTYRERWIPELGTASYPAPMVDHGVERDEALARYDEIKGR